MVAIQINGQLVSDEEFGWLVLLINHSGIAWKDMSDKEKRHLIEQVLKNEFD